MQKAALQLKLLGEDDDSRGLDEERWSPLRRHQRVPQNIPPTCLADHVFQSFAESKWINSTPAATEPHALLAATYPDKPNMLSLFDVGQSRKIDPTSAVVGDIIRSYKEIDSLPKQVATHYAMCSLMKVSQFPFNALSREDGH
jgi:hypothetical protein